MKFWVYICVCTSLGWLWIIQNWIFMYLWSLLWTWLRNVSSWIHICAPIQIGFEWNRTGLTYIYICVCIILLYHLFTLISYDVYLFLTKCIRSWVIQKLIMVTLKAHKKLIYLALKESISNSWKPVWCEAVTSLETPPSWSIIVYVLCSVKGSSGIR